MEIILLYMFICYGITLGAIIEDFEKDSITDNFWMNFWMFILAPLTVPIVLGMGLTEKKK